MPAGFGYGQRGYRNLRKAGASRAKARKLAFKRPARKAAAPAARARTRASARARFKR